MIWLHHMKYRRLLAVLQAANQNGKNGVAVYKHPDRPQSVLLVVLIPHPRSQKNKNRLTQSDRKAIGQCARPSPKSTRKRITEKYDGLPDHRMVACCMAFVSFVLTVKLLLPFLKRSSVI